MDAPDLLQLSYVLGFWFVQAPTSTEPEACRNWMGWAFKATPSSPWSLVTRFRYATGPASWYSATVPADIPEPELERQLTMLASVAAEVLDSAPQVLLVRGDGPQAWRLLEHHTAFREVPLDPPAPPVRD